MEQFLGFFYLYLKSAVSKLKFVNFLGYKQSPKMFSERNIKTNSVA